MAKTISSEKSGADGVRKDGMAPGKKSKKADRKAGVAVSRRPSKADSAADTVEADSAAAAPSPAAMKKSMKKAMKKASAAAPDTKTAAAKEVIGEEERKRRDGQRQVQQLVLQLKKEGVSDEEIKRRKNKLKLDLQYSVADRRQYWREHKQKNAETKKELGGLFTEKAAGGQAAADAGDDPILGNGQTAPRAAAEAHREDGDDADEDARDEKEALRQAQKAHEIIIIPIVWRGRHDRHQLMEATENVKRVLAQQGINTWIDSRRQHTPGQKFAFWEHKGVKFRIEIGPKDFERGKLCLCKHPEIAGDFMNTKKIYVPLPPEGARELLVQLRNFGFSKLDETIRGEDGATTTGDLPPADYSALYDRGTEVGGTVADYTQRFSSSHAVTKFGGGGVVKPQAHVGGSGDALEENFVLSETAAAGTSSAPKQKKRKVK
eukprot:g11480.t1